LRVCRSAGWFVSHAVDAVLVDEDNVLQLLELSPELVGLVGDGGGRGYLGLLELHLKVLNENVEGGTEVLQLGHLQVLDLDIAISDVLKIQFVFGVGARLHCERA
jgi:hypothetical protein